MFLSRKIYALVAVFSAGVGLGVCGMYASHLDESRFGAEYSRYQLGLPALLALPGEVIDEALLGRDYRFGEQWLTGRIRVPIINGLCLLVASLPFLILKRGSRNS